jgi:MFS family permease
MAAEVSIADIGARKAEEPWPSAVVAWYGVGVFTLATAFAFIDRQILVLLIEPIKKDLVVTDTQIGLLTGFAFVMLYVVLGIPIARLADVHSRKVIIGSGVAFWSLMTVVCGLAQNYWHLFWARVGVGTGEACNGPATFSIVADSFPPEKLPKATAVISTGFFLGSGIALIVGGAVIQAVAGAGNVTLPVFGEMRPWQMTFIIVGVPGLFVSALVFSLKEPRRRGVMALATGPDGSRRKSVPIREIFRFMGGDWRTYAPMYGGLALRSLTAFGMSVWLPSFFIRTYGWTAPQIGFVIGIILLTISPLGLWTGGVLAEWYARRGYDDANMRVNLISTCAVLPTSTLYPLMPTAELALALYATNSFLASLGPGPANAALQTITPNQMRAQFTALYLFIFNLIGFGLGPLVIATLTDYLFGAPEDLRYSMALTAAVLTPPAIVWFWSGLKPYGLSVARARERQSQVTR